MIHDRDANSAPNRLELQINKKNDPLPRCELGTQPPGTTDKKTPNDPLPRCELGTQPPGTTDKKKPMIHYRDANSAPNRLELQISLSKGILLYISMTCFVTCVSNCRVSPLSSCETAIDLNFSNRGPRADEPLTLVTAGDSSRQLALFSYHSTDATTMDGHLRTR